MKTALRAALVAGAIAAFVAAGLLGGEAEAKPVVSSWYGPGFEGSATASGETYRADAYTAAHPSLPFGTRLLVTYGERRAVVRITDRGPYVEDRDLDLSRAAAEKIGLTEAGADEVDVRVLAGSGARSPNRECDGVAALLSERPYLRILGAWHPERACWRTWKPGSP
jgi:rare lipoprotein A